jgi:hypothetical protein
LARSWYVAKFTPHPKYACVNWIRRSHGSYGMATFRVPLSTLYQSKEDGGWDLTNVSAKSHALLLYRMRENMMKQGSITWAWLRTWGPSAKGTNPPFRDVIPESLECLRCFAMDSAYMGEQGTMEPKRAYRRLYNILYNMNRRATDIREMRITKLWPTTDWTTVWKNIHCTHVHCTTKAAWYKAISDILPTNNRLPKNANISYWQV